MDDFDFDEAMLEARPRLRRFARVLANGDTFAADDLEQETIIKGYVNRDQFEPGTKFVSWLFRIMHNLQRDQARCALRIPTPIDSEEVQKLVVTEPAQVATVELREALDALSKLPKNQRDAVVLAADGQGYENAAADLGIPLGTFQSRVQRGRDALRLKTGRGLESEEQSQDFERRRRTH